MRARVILLLALAVLPLLMVASALAIEAYDNQLDSAVIVVSRALDMFAGQAAPRSAIEKPSQAQLPTPATATPLAGMQTRSRGVAVPLVDAVVSAAGPDLFFWTVPAGDPETAIGRLADDHLPRPERLADFAAASAAAQPVAAEARNGRSFVYAAKALSDGETALVGYDRSSLRAEARADLFRHAMVIALTLVFGVLIAYEGASRMLVRPIGALTRAVEHWRAGGWFGGVAVAEMPHELVELSQAFGHATERIAERERELGDAIAHQELLMQEIHHRVKNNLQIVASLLNLQANRIRSPDAKAEFQSARDRVRALATMHRHLYAEGALHTINMRSFLLELCGQLFNAMGERENDRIRLTVEAQELEMTSDQAVPLALIVTEAVSNAIRHAFPDGRHGHISVRFTVTDRIGHLVVEDDGVGLPTGQGQTEMGGHDGLGTQLIRGFSRQLGATLQVSEAGGTRYDVEIPLADPAARPAAFSPASLASVAPG